MSTSATDTVGALDLDAFLVELGAADDVPCAYRPTSGCENPAHWGYRCVVCGADLLVCDRHRAVIDHWLHSKTTRHAACARLRAPGVRCGTRYPEPLPWRPL